MSDQTPVSYPTPEIIKITIGPQASVQEVITPRLLTLVAETDPGLYQTCTLVSTAQMFMLKQLVADLGVTMTKYNGVGLAANQVGVSLQVFVLMFDRMVEFINPVIEDQSPEMVVGEEGCLSFPFLRAKVKRPKWIRMRWMNLLGRTEQGTFVGHTARQMCHEIDHLHGKTILDHLSGLEKRRANEQRVKARRKRIREG